MAEWIDYQPCCHGAAADRDALFCPECRHPLFRCADAACGGLVTPLGQCAACVDLRLSLEQGAVLDARLGECLEVPFVLRNSARGRSLSIRRVTRETTNGPQETVTLTWDRLDPGQTRAFKIATRPFEHAGLSSLKVTLVVSSAVEDVEETYAFAGDVAIDVEGAAPTRVINRYSASGTGAMVVNKPDAAAGSPARKRGEGLAARMAVPLERADRYEVEAGHRGYQATGVRVPRNVEFQFAGFPTADAPRNGPLVHRPVVRCGRNGRPREGRQDAQPNDLCLRVYDAASGELDRQASAAISRRACDFLLASDRLLIRSLTDTSVAVNSERLKAGTTRVVADGDSFSLPAGEGGRLTFGVAFKVSGGLVTQVRLEKSS